jgi:hypothetical protein
MPWFKSPRGLGCDFRYHDPAKAGAVENDVVTRSGHIVSNRESNTVSSVGRKRHITASSGGTVDGSMLSGAESSSGHSDGV